MTYYFIMPHLAIAYLHVEVDIASISSVVNGSIFKKNCTGSENSISECAGDVNTSDCDHSSDIVVFCYPSEPIYT